MRKHRQYIVRSLKMYLLCFFGKFTEDIMLRKLNNYFTTFEKILWIGSLVLITGSAVMFGKDGILSVIASLIGATSLLLNAKGNPIGQALGVIFSILLLLCLLRRDDNLSRTNRTYGACRFYKLDKKPVCKGQG